MAESEAVTFKVTPEIAARLAEAGTAQGKSRHLVAKDIVLNALNKSAKASDDAVAAALFELREELHQLSDYVVDQKEQSTRRANKRRPSKQMRQLVRNCRLEKRFRCHERAALAGHRFQQRDRFID